MVNRHLERYSPSQIISEMQIKTRMRYHLTSVRIAVIKKTRDNNKCWERFGKKRTLCTVGGHVNGVATTGNSVEGPEKKVKKSYCMI